MSPTDLICLHHDQGKPFIFYKGDKEAIINQILSEVYLWFSIYYMNCGAFIEPRNKMKNLDLETDKTHPRLIISLLFHFNSDIG